MRNTPAGTRPRPNFKPLIEPLNLAKTVGSLIPFASAAVEMVNQVQGAVIEERLETVEEQVSCLMKVRELESRAPHEPPRAGDFPAAIHQYIQRSVTLAVVYDGIHDPSPSPGRELFIDLAHGCSISSTEVLTSNAAWTLASNVAAKRNGRCVAIRGFAWFEVTADAPDAASGLTLLHLTNKDENKWREAVNSFSKYLGSELHDGSHLQPVQYSIMPYVAQEVGFLHKGEASDIATHQGAFIPLQFDKTTISHFRRASEQGLKTYVTSVLPGRVQQAGSGVFTQQGVLLGILSDTETYHSDAGRRAVIRSLLGHPRFKA